MAIFMHCAHRRLVLFCRSDVSCFAGWYLVCIFFCVMHFLIKSNLILFKRILSRDFYVQHSVIVSIIHGIFVFVSSVRYSHFLAEPATNRNKFRNVKRTINVWLIKIRGPHVKHAVSPSVCRLVCQKVARNSDAARIGSKSISCWRKSRKPLWNWIIWANKWNQLLTPAYFRMHHRCSKNFHHKINHHQRQPRHRIA